jgi:hypothetical protein
LSHYCYCSPLSLTLVSSSGTPRLADNFFDFSLLWECLPWDYRRCHCAGNKGTRVPSSTYQPIGHVMLAAYGDVISLVSRSRRDYLLSGFYLETLHQAASCHLSCCLHRHKVHRLLITNRLEMSYKAITLVPASYLEKLLINIIPYSLCQE